MNLRKQFKTFVEKMNIVDEPQENPNISLQRMQMERRSGSKDWLPF